MTSTIMDAIDGEWLSQAIALSRLCPPSGTAFSVGAVLVRDGQEVSRGYSRQEDEADHAEEVALRHAHGPLDTATLYCSMEPCGRRSSRPTTCAAHIIAAGIPRVVYAAAEPDIFVPALGARSLQEADITVIERHDFEPQALAANAHLWRK